MNQTFMTDPGAEEKMMEHGEEEEIPLHAPSPKPRLHGRNVIFALTGSVASTLASKVYETLLAEGANVQIVATKAALEFLKYDTAQSGEIFQRRGNSICKILTDADEWRKKYEKGDDILHIELRKWAHVLVIAPLSANTLAKMSNGLCDNLLTSLIRAWDQLKPIIVAPAMNTMMMQNAITQIHLDQIKSLYKASVIYPVSKTLACKDVGFGAMAPIDTIIDAVIKRVTWNFPLRFCRGIPSGNHPGAFGYRRKHDVHTGVDLYCNDRDRVHAVEDGIVVNREQFTGKALGHTWWEDTDCLLIRGASGIVCYGEIAQDHWIPIGIGEKKVLEIGSFVQKGSPIGFVKRVLAFGKERQDIPGHSLSMLHLELYRDGTDKSVTWELDEQRDKNLLDPTQFLLDSRCGVDEKSSY